MDESKKNIDESWKEAAEKEKEALQKRASLSRLPLILISLSLP